MIEVTGIQLSLREARKGEEAQRRAYTAALARRLRLKREELFSVELRKRSVDARKRDHLRLVYTLRAALKGGAPAEVELLQRLKKRHDDRGVRLVEEEPYAWPAAPAGADLRLGSRPVVVGAGCAGLFCALALAEAGLEPLLVERGDDAARRSEQVRAFDAGAALDPESNIQFGLGGAGTFSDGKLATGTRSPSHRLILETFVEAGASPDILWDAHPHVGSDVLPAVVRSIADRIESLGGELRFRSRLIDIECTGSGEGRRVRAITLERTGADGQTHEERIEASDVVLACGHSARDVFELLKRRGVALERKTFAMGVRIEHLQRSIDRALYGNAAGDPALGAAPYKLVCHLPQGLGLASGRSAFSFCMCPGGFVVAAASEPHGVVTNGMSLSARDGVNANAGLLVNVTPDDLVGDDVLAGIALQRRCEQAAYRAGGETYAAPAQLVGDFLAGRRSTGPDEVAPSYPRGVVWGAIDDCLPAHVVETLRAAIPRMARKLRGFDAPDAVLTGVETRSSSPVRVVRGSDLQCVSCAGLWPAGEGAGYAGGIMSAAADGIRIAESLIASRTHQVGSSS
jgi:uncharacterized FAD-dependent dehydrogenase